MNHQTNPMPTEADVPTTPAPHGPSATTEGTPTMMSPPHPHQQRVRLTAPIAVLDVTTSQSVYELAALDRLPTGASLTLRVGLTMPHELDPRWLDLFADHALTRQLLVTLEGHPVSAAAWYRSLSHPDATAAPRPVLFAVPHHEDDPA